MTREMVFLCRGRANPVKDNAIFVKKTPDLVRGTAGLVKKMIFF